MKKTSFSEEQLVKILRETVLIEMSSLRRLQHLPTERILSSQVEAFAGVIRSKFRDRGSTFGRDYLRAVVDKIVVTGSEAVITGGHATLMRAVGGGLQANQVPGLIADWRATLVGSIPVTSVPDYFGTPRSGSEII